METDEPQNQDPAIDTEMLKKTVAGMVAAAGHYLNWEKELGDRDGYSGLALVLGNKWAESSWTKLVGKSGEKFKMVADRLRAVKLPEQAEKYAALERRLVENKIEVLLAEGQHE